MLIIRVTTFKVTQAIRPQTINITARQTDRQHTMAILHFALCASHRKNKTKNHKKNIFRKSLINYCTVVCISIWFHVF